jgi:uncharacterized protein (TIGR03437 family)
MQRHPSRAGILTFVLTALAAADVQPQYRVETMAGSSNLGDGGPAVAAQFGDIQGIALDPWGNLYLSDTDHHRVRRIDPAGTVTTVAGIGSPGFSGDGGPATAAQLKLPYGLAVDLAGYLYIADLGNSRVRRVAPDGTISTYAGNGLMGSAGDGGLAPDAQLMSPRNVAVDGSGYLYIAEFTGHRVRRVAPDGKIATVAGIGIAGFREDDGRAATEAQLNFPAGLAVDRTGAVYVADSQNQRIRKFTAGGKIATALGGSSTTTLSLPTALSVDAAGTILVADATLMVHSFTAPSTWSTVAGTGASGYSGDGGPGGKAQLAAPHDLVTDPSGNIYISDGVRIRRVDRRGIIQTIAGDGYVHAVGDGLAATSALLNQPMAVALDSTGNLYIADSGTQRVRQVVPAGTIRTIAGTGLAGPGSEAVPATSSNLYAPMSVTMAPDGSLFVADTFNHRVRTIGLDGRIATFAGTGIGGIGREALPPAQMQLRGPRGVCLDRAGTVYIVDTSNHRVLRVPSGGVAETAAGNGAPGDAGDGGPARLAQLNQPSGCTVDFTGNLYIADTASNRIRKVTPAGVISTVAGTGASGFSGDEGPATAARIAGPLGVAVDGGGTIFFSDTGNHRIRLVTTDGVIHTIAGQGSPGFSGDGGLADSAQLNLPAGLALDGAGNVYFADSGNNRVRRLVVQQTVAPPPVTAPPPIAAANAASLREGAVAPGEILTIFGQGIGPESAATGSLDSAGLLANLVGGAEVRFDGVSAPIFYAQATQINLQVPYTVAGSAVTHVEVLYHGRSAGTLTLAVVSANPALFPSLFNQDGTPNSESNPAARGTIVTLFATGEGLGDGANVSGLPAQAPFARPRLPVSLAIGSIVSELLYAGSAPGLIGLMQINARIPGGFLPAGAAAIELTVGNFTAPAVKVFVK